METNIRNLDMAVQYQNGCTLENLANQYGVTKQRVQQLVTKQLGKEEIRSILHRRSTQLYLDREKSIDPVKKMVKAHRALVRAGLRWSTYSNECLGCKRDDVVHNRYGYCAKCAYVYIPGVKEARKKATNEYNKKNPEKKRIRDLRNTKAFHERLRADPVKLAAFKKQQDDYYGGTEARKEHYRLKGRERYEKIKEIRIVEAEIRKEFPDYSHPFLIEYRKKVMDKYYRNKLKKKQ